MSFPSVDEVSVQGSRYGSPEALGPVLGRGTRHRNDVFGISQHRLS